jgi:hypothetical protein
MICIGTLQQRSKNVLIDVDSSTEQAATKSLRSTCLPVIPACPSFLPARHSCESRNPSGLWLMRADQMDSRLRGNDGKIMASEQLLAKLRFCNAKWPPISCSLHKSLVSYDQNKRFAEPSQRPRHDTARTNPERRLLFRAERKNAMALPLLIILAALLLWTLIPEPEGDVDSIEGGR